MKYAYHGIYNCYIAHKWRQVIDSDGVRMAVLIALYAPGKAVHGGPTYTNSHRNKNVNVDKIKHIFIILVLPTKSVFFKH